MPRVSERGPTVTDKSLFLKHQSGANHIFRGRRLTKLLSELKAGRGGPEITALVLSGYSETMGGISLDDASFESLDRESRGDFSAQ